MLNTFNGRFEKDGEDQLAVIIDTPKLVLTSIQENDFEDSFNKTYGDQDVMYKVGYGKTMEKEELKVIFDKLIAQWKNNDPFSGLTVRLKETDEFAGHVILEPYEPGTAELSYLFAKEHWGKGIGTEAVTSVVNEFSPELVRREYQTGGKPFTTLFATAKTDNFGSQKILKKVGMEEEGIKVRSGAQRYHYTKRVT